MRKLPQRILDVGRGETLIQPVRMLGQNQRDLGFLGRTN